MNSLGKFIDKLFYFFTKYLKLLFILNSSFRKRQELIREQFDGFSTNQSFYKKLLEQIDSYIDILSNIPLLPQILKEFTTNKQREQQLDGSTNKNYPKMTVFNNISCQSINNLQDLQLQDHIETTTTTIANNTADLNTSNANVTLLDWIKTTDTQNKLSNVIDETREMLKTLESNFKWTEIDAKVNNLLTQIDSNPQMREIEGLTKRLQDLNSFLEMSGKLLSAQNEIRESFSANLKQATKLNDESILQDLCKGHERQLELFAQNHSQMIEITSKMSKAKLELIRVIHSRLHWVMKIQNKMAELDFHLQINFKQLKRLNVRILMLDQLKRAPSIYFSSMKETIRRQSFTKAYKSFATTIINLIMSIYNKEMERRRKFSEKNNSSAHFILNILFRSLKDKVDLFVLDQEELKFDSDLPNITESDVKNVKQLIIDHLAKKNVSLDTSSDDQLNNFEFIDESLMKELRDTDDSSTSSDFYNLEEDVNLLNKIQTYVDHVLDFNENIDYEAKKLDQKDLDRYKTEINSAKSILNEIKETVKLNNINFVDNVKIINNHLNKHANNIINDKTVDKNDTQQFLSKIYNLAQDILKTNDLKSLNELPLNDVGEEKNINSELAFKLINLIKSNQTENLKQIEELKTNIKTIKTTMNADKQILFNEAIKKATQEKDKTIDDLRNKEASYLKQIDELKEALSKKTDLPQQQSTLISSSTNPDESTKQLDDMEKTKSKLKEIMLVEKISQLEKQLSLFTTLPLTNDYETIQLNSCNIDDLVIAVYSDEYNSYKIIHKTSSYLHFVHSAIFKNHEQRLSFKNACTTGSSKLAINSSQSQNDILLNQYSTSPPNDNTNIDIESTSETNKSNIRISDSTNQISNISVSCSSELISNNNNTNVNLASPLVKNSPADDIDSIFMSEKQPQWFVGRVLVKEFCIARRVFNFGLNYILIEHFFYF